MQSGIHGQSSGPEDPTQIGGGVRSLKDLLERGSIKNWLKTQPQPDSGLAEILPFPFLALVGQVEMKYALLLGLINPAVGGVLLIGPRGTGKTTAIRGLVNLVPEIPRSLCYYGCMPEDIESGGMDAVCPECARKYAMGEPLTVMDKIRLVELPLNTRLEDVLGGMDDANTGPGRLRIRRGILAHADRNLLLVDEVNLLADDVVDAILDAAAYGSYSIKRGAGAATFRSRFVLLGTMNPEEGRLRPQIMDRFGLRIVIKGLSDEDQRMEAYQRAQGFSVNPHLIIQEFEADTQNAQAEIQAARDLLPKVKISETAARMGLNVIRQLEIHSLRGEVTLFEAARAFAALDGRMEVSVEDIQKVAPMALRMRRSEFMNNYLLEQDKEREEIKKLLGG